MFQNLSEKLESAFKGLKGQSRITELNIAATVKEIRRALVDADVNYKIAKEFTDKIKDKAMGEKVINAISPGQLMVKIPEARADELVADGTVAKIVMRGREMREWVELDYDAGDAAWASLLAEAHAYLNEITPR